jgi:uncharacterized protein (TIGR03790 family)
MGPSDFSHYNVYRSGSFAGPYVFLASTATTSFEDTTAIPGNTYFYQITSVDLYGNESDPSDPISITFPLSSQTVNLASIGPENVIVVYREADSESEDAATRYQSLHGLAGDQLVEIPCSSREILDSYADFQTEVENPIIEALTGTSSPLVNRIVYAIVLMPRVPGGFRDGNDVISSTSRLPRMFFTFDSEEKYLQNPLYDRKTFKRFDELDADTALIVTRIDSPVAAVTNQWFDNLSIANSQLLINGTFYFDAFSAYQGNAAAEYETELLEFKDDLLQRLGTPIVDTIRVDPYQDALISKVEDDSFFWGWGADRGSLSFFRASANIRGFFYNADFDGAETMRDIDARTWPLLAIRQGYIASAGSMSDPGIENFMRPDPFFSALFRGATMGEAMLYSQPRLNTPIACFGDPLSRFTFPLVFDSRDLISQDQAWQNINECFARSCINIFRKNVILKEARDLIVAGDDEDVTRDLARPFNRLGKLFEEPDWKTDYVNLAIAMYNLVVIRNQTAYEEFYPGINDYLTRTNTIIPEITLDVLINENTKVTVEEQFLYEEGTWEFTFELEHNPGTFAFYHFEIDISTDADFDEILFSRDSFQSVRNWFFEREENQFVQMGVNGVTSNFAGFRIRYESQDGEQLERGRYYYFRVRQKDQLTIFGYRNFREVVYR